MARIATRSYFDEERRQQFRLALVTLRVNGHPADSRLFASIASALEGLEAVASLSGTCRDSEQRLLLLGHVRGENPRTPRLFQFDLTPGR